MLRSSTELRRIDSASPIFVEEDEELQRRQYVTPLSPRLQAAGPFGGSAESQQQQRRSSGNYGGGAAASSARTRLSGGQPFSPSSPTREAPLSVAPDPSGPSTAATTSKGTAYRRYEREVESLQQQLDREMSGAGGSVLAAAYRPGGASSVAALSEAVSTTTSLPLDPVLSSTEGLHVDSPAPPPLTGQATPTNRRAKRVSLGQVSIDGVPVITIDSATTDSIGHPSSARPRASSGSRQRASSGTSPAGSRDGEKSRRRRTMTESNRNSSVLSTLRERRLSDPTSALDSYRASRAEEGGRRLWLLEGGRNRQATDVQNVGRGRNRIAQGAANAQQSTTALSTEASRSPQRLGHPLDVGSTSNPATPRLAAASIMRWDAAQSTALSLRHGNGSAAPMYKQSNETGRYSTPSEVVSHNRLAAYRYLNALNALRARIPAQASASLRPLRYQSILARLHHRTLIFQAYMHVPATIFFDFSALFTLVQIAYYPDINASGAAWWIATGVYAAFFLAWLVGVVVVWEGVVEYRRRWVTARPFALPIYLSAPAFTLTAIKSFSLYSLLYRARFSAPRRDMMVESFWFYGQNWPTVLTLIPRGVILAVVLVLYNATGGTANTRQPLAGQMRDPVYFANDTGRLTTYAFTVLAVNAAWMAWRVLVLLAAWTGLAVALGPRWMFRREAAYYQGDESDVSMSEMGRHAAGRPLLDMSRTSDVAMERDVDWTAAGASIEALEMSERQSASVPRRPLQPKVAASERETGVQATSHTRSTDAPTMQLPRWAWRQRAEERINGLLYQCHIMVSEEDSHANDGQGNEAPSPQQSPQQQKRPYRAMSLYDPEAAITTPRRGGGSLDTVEEHGRKKASVAVTSLPVLSSADDSLSTSAQGEAVEDVAGGSAIAGPSSVSAAVSTAGAFHSGQSQSALKEKTSDGGISVSSYPFPRKSQDTSIPSAAATVYTAAKSSPMRSDSRSVVASFSSGAVGDATASTPVLESSAMSREHRSNDTVRQEKRSSGPSIKQEERLTWWTGLWAGSLSRKRDSPSEGASLKSLPATPPREAGTQTESSSKTPQEQLQPTVRAESPMSGMRTERTQDASGSSGSREQSEVKSEDHAAGSRADDVEDTASSTGEHSATTEDSEEQRIWAAFPEQSRRHPPGLIALEMEQRRLEKEREDMQRRRGSQQRRWSNEDADPLTRNTPPLQSTSRHSPRFTTSLSVVEDESTDTPVGEGTDIRSGDLAGGNDAAADTSYDSASNVVSGSPAEGLGMIQEESWSSGLATDDDELERLCSPDPRRTRREGKGT